MLMVDTHRLPHRDKLHPSQVSGSSSFCTNLRRGQNTEVVAKSH